MLDKGSPGPGCHSLVGNLVRFAAEFVLIGYLISSSSDSTAPVDRAYASPVGADAAIRRSSPSHNDFSSPQTPASQFRGASLSPPCAAALQPVDATTLVDSFLRFLPEKMSELLHQRSFLCPPPLKNQQPLEAIAGHA